MNIYVYINDAAMWVDLKLGRVYVTVEVEFYFKNIANCVMCLVLFSASCVYSFCYNKIYQDVKKLR